MNGDFSSGKNGFSCGYIYTPNNTIEGEYFVGSNPSEWYPAHYSCGDHTNGKGKMLLVNGSPKPNVEVWKTSILVKPNTTYSFSTWICSISEPNPAQLAFSINGTTIGNLITAGQPPCKWYKFHTTWNSGSEKTAVIAIINKNTIAYGNDFALDDIYFGIADTQFPPPGCTSRIPARFDFTVSDCFTAIFKPLAKKSKSVKQISWNFGDGSSSSLWKPAHRYKRPGTYKVTAVITSSPDCRDTFSRSLTIKPIRTDFSYTEMGQPGKLAFKAERTGHTYDWNFGDGNFVRQAAVAFHQYLESGSYTTTLVTTNASGCRDSLQKSILVVLPDKIMSEAVAVPQPESAAGRNKIQLEQRVKEIIKKIEVEQDSVTILLYDNGIIDGDSIALLLDEQVLLTQQLLARTPIRLTIPVNREKESHELTMYAENLGSIPPNTAYMVILDGTVKYEIYISSSKKSNGVVLFTRNIYSP